MVVVMGSDLRFGKRSPNNSHAGAWVDATIDY